MIDTLVIDPRIKVRTGKELLNFEPTVIYVNDIEEAAVQPFAAAVSTAHSSGQTILPIVLNSGGGDLYALWAMADILEASKIPIATIITGRAMSAGSALFCCGTNGFRFVGPHASLMIHDVSSDQVSGKPHEMKADTEETDRLNRSMYEFMETKIGKRKGYLWRLAEKRGHADWYLSPDDAVKHGLANHIKIPILSTKVSVETTLDWTE